MLTTEKQPRVLLPALVTGFLEDVIKETSKQKPRVFLGTIKDRVRRKERPAFRHQHSGKGGKAGQRSDHCRFAKEKSQGKLRA